MHWTPRMSHFQSFSVTLYKARRHFPSQWLRSALETYRYIYSAYRYIYSAYRWWSISPVPLPCQSFCVKYPQPPQKVSGRRIFHLWRKLETASKGCCWTTVGFPVGSYWCLHLAASVLNVRWAVAFFRSKVAASCRKLVVFIVYDGEETVLK